MYRIDDNTYIDTSLITCAEYQLFIDEMYAQGKYYQPDHWTSYQFPEGEAQAPILGVRPSDAFDFCEWLTHSKGQGWRYRIPTEDEANSHLLSPLESQHFGYWVSPSRVSPAAIWAIHKSCPHIFTIDTLRDRAVAQALSLDDDNITHSLGFRQNPYELHSIIRTLALAREGDTNLTETIDRVLFRDLNQIQLSAADFDLALINAMTSIRARVIEICQSSKNETALALLQDIDLVCNIDLAHNLKLANDLTFARDRCLIRALKRPNEQNDLLQIQEIDLNLMASGFIDISLNILVLQLRRIGVYIPFEGIRIVTEPSIE